MNECTAIPWSNVAAVFAACMYVVGAVCTGVWVTK